ncbi:DUF2812 domain-containing protein [Solibacillus sp. FSL K6-4121]|uniref:DUF2812 domain-containing protein n=1 Tax=Solibacillus sp. FSL K6-4121 TaxID=2921505 RepID=UPI0030FB55F6
MRIFKFFFDDAKEENWINDMANQGWLLKKIRFSFYYFEQGEQGEYEYRLEVLDHFLKGKDVKEYLDFTESAGIELIQKRLNWLYFRQNKSKGPFELYSDASSKLNYFNRMLSIYYPLLFINFLAACTNGAFALGELTYDVNFLISVMNLLAVLLLIVPTINVIKRKRILKKEMAMFEN